MKKQPKNWLEAFEYLKDLIRKSSEKKKKNAIYPTLITTYGLVENSYSQEVQSVVTMDDLF